MGVLNLLHELGHWSIAAVWVPVLVWSLVALAASALLLRSSGRAVHVKYRIVTAIIASLPCGLLAAQLLAPGIAGDTSGGLLALPEVVIQAGTDSRDGGVLAWTVFHTAGLLLVASVLAALWRGGLLVAGCVRLRRLNQMLPYERDTRIRDMLESLAAELGISRTIRVALSAHARAPMTFGWRHPVIVLPSDLADTPEDMRLTLLHELVHIRRHDYAVHWFEQIVGAAFFIHPLVAILRRESSLLRETSCDADVVSIAGGRAHYARLLYRFSTTRANAWTMAVGISLQENHLQKRISAMKDFVDFSRITAIKRIGILLALLLFGASAVLVACSEQFVTTDPQASDEAQTAEGVPDTAAQEENPDIFVVVEEMPKLVGGLQSVQENLRYPELAMKAGVEGRVIVQFVVDEKGAVQDLKVVRGIGSGLDAAALKAVESAAFEPGRQRGEPVKVKMSLPITFKLPGSTENTGNRTEATGSGSIEISYNISGNAVRGRVVDSNSKDGLAGVNLSVEGTAIGAVSGPSGEFTLRLESAEKPAALRASHPDYQPVFLQNIK